MRRQSHRSRRTCGCLPRIPPNPQPPSSSSTPAAESKDLRLPSQDSAEPAAAVFLLHSGCLTGPARLSTLGVRAVKEQTSVGSSLFAQPLMLEAVPLAEETQPTTETGAPHLETEMWVSATSASSAAT